MRCWLKSPLHQWRWQPETVYLGGGTPSGMATEDLKRLLVAIPGREHWKEATIEVAPGTISPQLAAGVASRGHQSCQPGRAVLRAA